MAGRQTTMDFLPLSRERAGPVRRRGIRACMTWSGVMCVALRKGTYVLRRDICSRGACTDEVEDGKVKREMTEWMYG